MLYKSNLQEGLFLRRYKRFFADIQIDGQTVVAHVPNTGSLKGVCDIEGPCRISPAANPERKLQWTLEQVQVNGEWVGVNTQLANTLAREVITERVLPHWQTVDDVKSEVKLNKETRFDFGLHRQDRKMHFVEVKSVTLRSGEWALFPDAETTRGQKHLRELITLAQTPDTIAEILFIVQRNDCNKFMAAETIDPEYAKLLAEAHHQGVLIHALSFVLTDRDIVYNKKKGPLRVPFLNPS